MLKKILASTLVSACAMLLHGCATVPSYPVNSAQVVTLSAPELPAPAGVALDEEVRPYFLGPRDKLEVLVYGEPDLSVATVQVGGAGTIFLPVIGEVDVNGLTTSEVSLKVEERLATILQRPRVAVNVLEGLSQTALIDGAVAQPGAKPVVGRTTLQQVLADAGGPTEFASTRRVLLMRTVDDRTFASFFDLNRIRYGVYSDPEVFAGDRIYVGESQIRQAFDDALRALPLLYLIARR